MKTVKNVDEIINRLNISIQKSLIGSVSEYVKENVNRNIKKDVYGAYRPQVYKRKFMLYDDKNHNKEVLSDDNGAVARYYHRAYMGGKDLTKLILLGQDGAKAYGSGVALYNEEYIRKYKASGANDTNPFYKPRNFITSAKSDIKKSDIVKILKSEIR